MIQLLRYAWLLLIIALWLGGCHQGPGMVDAALEPATRLNYPIPEGFWPAQVTVLPLTRLTGSQDDPSNRFLHLFVGLQDRHHCSIKSPGVFRMELYEHVPRSAQAKGRRLSVWPDLDLNEPDRNQDYWRDFLRCYEFRLDLPPGTEIRDEAILEITFLGADKRRLSTRDNLTLAGN